MTLLIMLITIHVSHRYAPVIMLDIVLDIVLNDYTPDVAQIHLSKRKRLANKADSLSITKLTCPISRIHFFSNNCMKTIETDIVL